MPQLIVEYTCSECLEDAEFDDDGGLICRRCGVVFSGWSDGSEGTTLEPGVFADNYGSNKPQPTRRERLDATLKSLRS